MAKTKLTQNQIALKALQNGRAVTSAKLATKGIANPRAVISNLRKEGFTLDRITVKGKSCYVLA
jgi:hypothetical protein